MTRFYKSRGVTNVNRALIGMLMAFPWLCATYGGWLSHVPLDMIIAFATISLVKFILFYFTSSSVLNQRKRVSYNKYWYYFVIVINLLVLLGRFRLSLDNNFQLGLVRHLYFSDVGRSYVFFGSSLFDSLYTKILFPLSLILVVISAPSRLLSNVLTCTLLISALLIGGRFMIYYLIVIVVIKQLLRNKIWSHSYLYLIILVFISFIIIANRLGLDITSSSEYIFKQIEAYHVIQLPILSDYNTFPVSFSPYLGIETPISYIFGFTPSETKLAAHLNSIEAFTYRSDGPFNAYGTSLAYFFPLFGVTIGTGMYLTMFTMIYLCIFFNLNRSRGELLVLFGFLSYFSAFSPLAFSFAFYIYLLLFLLSFAVIRSCKNKDNKSLKVKL